MCKNKSLYICVSARVCVCVCLSFSTLLVPFHLEVRGQQSNQSRLPSAPLPASTCPLCVCLFLRMCVVPPELSVSKCAHDCGVMACMCSDLCSCVCVFSPRAIVAPMSTGIPHQRAGMLEVSGSSKPAGNH